MSLVFLVSLGKVFYWDNQHWRIIVPDIQSAGYQIYIDIRVVQLNEKNASKQDDYREWKVIEKKCKNAYFSSFINYLCKCFLRSNLKDLKIWRTEFKIRIIITSFWVWLVLIWVDWISCFVSSRVLQAASRSLSL